MKKLALKLEDLDVDSFPTGRIDAGHGTVHGLDTEESACVSRCFTCGIDPFRRGEGGVLEDQLVTRGAQCACA